MVLGRRRMVDLLVAEAKARKRALAAGVDPEQTPEVKAVVKAEAALLAERAAAARWAQQIDGSDARQPRGISPSALAEARRLRPLH